MRKIAILWAVLAAFAGAAKAAGSDTAVTVSLQNLSTGQSIMACPLYAVGPCDTAPMFPDGNIASVELEKMAEGAVASPLVSWLQTKGWRVVLGPGEIYSQGIQVVTIPVPPLGQVLCLSVIGKFRQTNDGFVGIDNLPIYGNTNRWHYAPARDAGTECNDELCANMPVGGGACSAMGQIGQGFNPQRCQNEKMISFHSGINGGGDLLPKYNNFAGERPARVYFKVE